MLIIRGGAILTAEVENVSSHFIAFYCEVEQTARERFPGQQLLYNPKQGFITANPGGNQEVISLFRSTHASVRIKYTHPANAAKAMLAAATIPIAVADSLPQSTPPTIIPANQMK